MEAAALPGNLLKPVGAPAVAKGSHAAIEKTAHEFEAAFLSSMLSTLFQNVETPAPFGGGSAEGTYKSFLTDAFAKRVAQAGGVGLAPAVAREMLKLQGLE